LRFCAGPQAAYGFQVFTYGYAAPGFAYASLVGYIRCLGA
jgi:hypothetical protein